MSARAPRRVLQWLDRDDPWPDLVGEVATQFEAFGLADDTMDHAPASAWLVQVLDSVGNAIAEWERAGNDWRRA